MFPDKYLEFIDVFSNKQAETLPEHRKWDIAIRTKSDFTPHWQKVYNLSQEESNTLKQYIDDNLAKGFIRPSTSPCGAPVFYVPKKGGKFRLCVDYRALNTATIKDRYPIPLIDGLMDKLQNAKVSRS